jgi:hypothetical protein
MSGRGGIGRHTGLKILRLNRRAGSSPAVRTKLNLLNNSLFFVGNHCGVTLDGYGGACVGLERFAGLWSSWRRNFANVRVHRVQPAGAG